jgi:hypothetical protein
MSKIRKLMILVVMALMIMVVAAPQALAQSNWDPAWLGSGGNFFSDIGTGACQKGECEAGVKEAVEDSGACQDGVCVAGVKEGVEGSEASQSVWDSHWLP